MSYRLKEAPFLLLTFIAISITLSCGGQGSQGNQTTQNNQGGVQNAQLRILDGIASGNLNVLQNQTTLASNMQYLNLTNYLQVESGAQQLTALPPGAPSDASSIIRASSNLSANSHNTFFLFGFGFFVGGAVLLDDTTAAANNDAKLRLFDAEASGTSMDAYVMPVGSAPAGSPVASAMEPGNASSYMDLSPGSYDVYFVVSTQSCPIASRPCPIQILYQTSINVATGQNRTLVLRNDCPNPQTSPYSCNENSYASVTLPDLN